MNGPVNKIAVMATFVGLAVGCACAAIGGKPALPPSDKSGTARIFDASEAETIAAITNAFADLRYRGMKLDNAVGRQYLAPRWHPTNGFVLFPLMASSITNVPLGRVDGPRVPYAACFHIITVPAGTNLTKVVVRTIVSEVIDGKEPGVHAQWAFHYRKVPPVRQEEENVIAALSGKLILGK